MHPFLLVPNTPEEQLKYLRDNLGDPFVDWILANPTDPLTEQQKQVLGLLIMAVVRGRLQTSGRGHPLLLYNLLAMGHYNGAVGATDLSYLRRLTSGEDTPTFPRSGDSLLDALTDLAVEMYGELLLTIQDSRFIPIGPLSSPAALRLRERIAESVQFPFESASGSSIFTVSSTGMGGGIQVEYAGPSVINATWRTACLIDPVPSLEELISALPPMLEKARRALMGRTVRIKGVCSLTGLTLPSDCVLELEWGRIRSARPSDHPQDVGDMVERRLVSGSSGVQITDAGEGIVEADINYRLYIRDPANEAKRWPPATSQGELQQRLTQLQLALLLALERDAPPVLIPSWSLFIEPISQGRSVGRSDPHLFARRQPTAITES